MIWWSASHLVWNCTVVDDAEDASGQGLLAAAGIAEELCKPLPTHSELALVLYPVLPRARTSRASEGKTPTPSTEPRQPWFKRFSAGGRRVLVVGHRQA